MSSKTPKTGLAARMRGWMSVRQRPFTVLEICGALEIPPGRERARVNHAVEDAVRRGELVPLPPDRRNRNPARRYLYNPGWHRVNKGLLQRRICKAMYVSGTWAVTDIVRLAEAPSRDWVDRIVRRLRDEGLVRPVGRRVCAHGIGTEAVYHLADRDRFNLEVLR